MLIANKLLFTKKQIKYNITPFKRNKFDITWIVIHFTANYNKYADDSMHFVYFNSKYIGASADFFIDKDSVTQVNNFYDNYTWGVGDGNGKYGITNKNSIHIEICVNDDMDSAIKNTELFIREYLLKELSHIDEKHLVRHYDASRKLCPIFFVDLKIKGYNKAYTDFRNNIFNYNKKLPKEIDISKILKEYNIKSIDDWITTINTIKFLPDLIQKLSKK